MRFWPRVDSEPHIWTSWAPSDSTTLSRRIFRKCHFFLLFQSSFGGDLSIFQNPKPKKNRLFFRKSWKNQKSTQKFIFGPDDLYVIIQHFPNGIFEILIFFYFPSPVLVGKTYRFFKIRNLKKFAYFSENHERKKTNFSNCSSIVPTKPRDTWGVLGVVKSTSKRTFRVWNVLLGSEKYIMFAYFGLISAHKIFFEIGSWGHHQNWAEKVGKK